MPQRIYLDWNATAPMRPEARTAITDAMVDWANPSSIHADGRAAKAMLEGAREDVAAALGCRARDVVFTSGGTEALTLGLHGTMFERRFVSAIEHDAVLASVPEARRLPVTQDGIVDLDTLRDAVAGEPALVAVMHANNETGAIQPIEDIAEIVADADGFLLVDAVQTVGKLALPSADMVTMSGHKVGGPPGIGAMIVRDRSRLNAVQKGGGQERGLRGGTENIPAAVGLAAALKAAQNDWLTEARRRHNRLEEMVKEARGEVFAEGIDRLPNTSLIRLPGAPASTQLMQFDLAGFSVSSGAACSSGKVGAGHVLAAMGVPASMAGEAIRVSTGWSTTDEDVDAFADAWLDLAERKRAA
ncbi:MAG: cysteine desulfurase family protein [Pacificimonas sp.]